MRVLALLVTLTTACQVLASDTHRSESKLVELVRAADGDPENEDLIRTAIDSPPPVASQIVPFLKTGSDDQRLAALVALAYLDGERSLAALQSYYSRTKNVQSKALLCFALASRGSPEDRSFLIRSLRGEHFGDEWPPIVAAALSLGVLRAREASGALRATAKKDESIASEAAAEALRWIEHGSWEVRIPDSELERDQVIAAVFRNGIPRSDESATFFEAERGGIWQFKDNMWSFHPGERSPQIPSIRLDVHVNPQGTRAVVSVGLTFGRLNGSGYDYVLERRENGWNVVGVMFTWIS